MKRAIPLEKPENIVPANTPTKPQNKGHAITPGAPTNPSHKTPYSSDDSFDGGLQPGASPKQRRLTHQYIKNFYADHSDPMARVLSDQLKLKINPDNYFIGDVKPIGGSGPAQNIGGLFAKLKVNQAMNDPKSYHNLKNGHDSRGNRLPADNYNPYADIKSSEFNEGKPYHGNTGIYYGEGESGEGEHDYPSQIQN